MLKKIVLKKVPFVAPKKNSYSKKELERGRAVEREHTQSKKAADIIAKNHLDEDKAYYTKLAKIESKPKKEKKRKEKKKG